MAWAGNHTLKPDEYYVVHVGWTENGAPNFTEVSLQTTSWYVSELLWLRADQETGRAYYWHVYLARKETGDNGQDILVPISPPSKERSFYWN